MNKYKLHIVAFDVPFPPNYGGVIDIYYKLKTLYELGTEIHLHVYEYGRGKPLELEKYCKKVYYYTRNFSIFNIISTIPFVVKSRSNSKLINNLKTIKADILFEGLHATYPLLFHPFIDRKILVRTHNIEHFYYKGLAKSESNILKKIFFWIESLKLKKYELILNKATYILTISPFEQQYFKNIYQDKAIYIPVFHSNNIVKSFENKGKNILYHGDLRISDNIKVVNFLIDTFKDFPYKLIIASSFENQSISNRISKSTNVEFIKIFSIDKMDELFKETHINILFTFQKTGIKLKLINSLYQGRHIIANSEMVEDTGLESLCEIVNNKFELRKKIISILKVDYNNVVVQKRKAKLMSFNTEVSAKKIIELVS